MTASPNVAVIPAVIGARAVLRGRVQGLGVRPAIAAFAARCGVVGTVGNVAEGVSIVVEGAPPAVTAFRSGLAAAIPREAVVESCHWTSTVPRAFDGFTIVRQPAQGVLATPVPCDRGLCAECRRDTLDHSSRRHGDPFTSCTRCGPRFSIIRSMPYERAATTMHAFAMCDFCRDEFTDPADRRFHAQTICCPRCGPRLWCEPRSTIGEVTPGNVISAAAAQLRAGRIVAICGVGGYQLVCDATNREAVARLRTAKHRPDKPFAVMVADGAATRNSDRLEAEVLRSAANPIVIQAASQEQELAAEVTRGLSSMGTLLPTTALHAMLAEQHRGPLVITSGNRDGDPLATEVAESNRDLVDIADLIVHHDRPIAHPVDDSVVRVIAGRPVTLRLARGLAPLPLSVLCSVSGVALGAHQKVAIALSNGVQSVLGPHIGDLDTLSMRDRFEAHVQRMLELFDCRPSFIAVDQHPDYFTTRWAQPHASMTITVSEGRCELEASRVPVIGQKSRIFPEVRNLVRVQHHHAHIAAGMLEHGWQHREVLGVAFDGTGFGSDGTIWGGEFLRCTLSSFQRVGSLRPFRLPGGERAIREPWRVAVALLAQVMSPADVEIVCRRLLPAGIDWQAALSCLGSPRLAPVTTSAGRLFDGVAALVLGLQQASFEGQPAMWLEDCCDQAEPDCAPFEITHSELLELDWRPAIRSLLRDLAAGISAPRLAMRFHRGLARGIGQMCKQLGDDAIVLGGGVFQNRVLVEAIAEEIPASRLGLPGVLPPNDGGLAAGQLAIASYVLSTIDEPRPE